MKSPSSGSGAGSPKPALPIDIHYNKLLDWLIDRRHCNVNWATDAVVVRGKINSAVSLPLTDIPQNEKLSFLLSIPHLNYFHVLEVVDILNATEKEKKNFLGQCTSPVLNAWTEVTKLYQKNGVFLAEAAQQLIRFVNYEIAALKKSVDKNQKMVKECQRKESEYDQQVQQIAETFKSKCCRLGISGTNVKRELLQQVEDLPRLYQDIADDCKDLQTIVKFYSAFLSFLGVEDATFLPILRHILEKGNTTVFEYRTGMVPSRAVAPEVALKNDDADAQGIEEEADIDWGDIDLDVVEGGDGDHFGETIEINWEGGDDADGGVEIDWGGVDESLGNAGVVDFEVVGDSDVMTSVQEGEVVAVGKEALTLLENPETRATLFDELVECESFLLQRLTEIRREEDILSANQFQNADLILQNADEKKVEAMLTSLRKVISGLQGEKVVQLGLIKANPRSLERLAEGVTQYTTLGDRMQRNRDHVALRRVEAEEENILLLPQIESIRKKTKELQKKLEDQISQKYDARHVNIMGEINMI